MSALQKLRSAPLLLVVAANILAQTGTIQQLPPVQPPAGNTPIYKAEELCTLEGAVFDKLTGAPLKKVNLTLSRINLRNPVPVAPAISGSNESGKFIFRSIEPGEYRLSADRNGFVRAEYGQRGTIGRMGQGTTVKLDKGQKLSDLKFELIPHAIVTGRVVDEDGDPIANAQIMLTRTAYMQGRRQQIPAGGAGTTNDLGEFRIFGVAPGKYQVSAIARGSNWEANGAVVDPKSGAEEGYAPTYYPGVSESSAASYVDVGLGARVQGIDFTLRRTRTYRISGKVTAPGLSRGRGGPVMLVKRDAGEGSYMFMDRGNGYWRGPAGEFTLRGVRPGAYYLQAYLMDNNERLSARLPVDITDSNVDGVNLFLTGGADVIGTVRAEGEQQPSLEGVSIYLRASVMGGYGFEGSAGRARADGSFIINNALRDKVWVSAVELPEGYYVKSIRAADSDALRKELDLSGGAGAQVEVTIAPGAAQIQGAVTDDKDKAAAGMTVLLIPMADELRQRSDMIKRAQTDQTGRYTIQSVSPGEYLMFAVDPPDYGAEQDPEFLKQHESKAQKVKLDVGAKESRDLKVVVPAV